MSIFHKWRKILSGAVVVALTAALAAGCGSEKQSASTAVAEKPEKVTIGVQAIPNDESAARDWYEKELGVKVVFKQFDSGRDVNTAMTAGQIDIAILGTAPAAIGISKNIPYEVFWIHDVEGENESLAVKNSANVQSLKDLEGKKVAVPVGSTAQYSLLNALKDAGADVTKVKILDMQPPEIFAAWQRGDIDAAYVWQPTLGKILSDGKLLVTGRQLAEKGIVTADVGIVNKDFAKKYPELVKQYVKLQQKAYDLFKSNPDEAAANVAKALNIDGAEAKKEMQELVWLSLEEQGSERYFGTSDKKGGLVKTLKETADFLVEQGDLDAAPGYEAFEQSVNPSFIEAAR